MAQLDYADGVRYVFQNAKLASASSLSPVDYWRRFDRLLDVLGRPDRLPAGHAVVHVAGTNGKGTTTALCAEMLRAAGVGPVGLFTSPHVHCWRERIRIDGRLASREQITAGVRVLRAAEIALAAEAHSQEEAGAKAGPAGDTGLTPFERLTALALIIFRAAGVRWLVLETGLGGRWDCTNHVVADRLPLESRSGTEANPHSSSEADERTHLTWPAPIAAEIAVPAVVGICRVGLDHMNVLGGTLAKIAAEKAGILKRGVPAFSTPQPAEAEAVIRVTASERGAPLAFPGLDDADLRRLLELAALDGAAADAASAAHAAALPVVRATSPATLPLWLRPVHQQHNLALAVALVRALLASAEAASRPASDAAGSALPASRGGAAESVWERMPRWEQPTIDAALRGALVARWPGRLEAVTMRGVAGADGARTGSRLLLFDCAHNEDALCALLAHLGSFGWSPRAHATEALEEQAALDAQAHGVQRALTIVFGANRDKDARTLLRMLGEFAMGRARSGGIQVRAVHLVASSHPKACDATALLALAREEAAEAPWAAITSVAAAVDLATGLAATPSETPMDLLQPEETTLFVGSVAIVGDARTRLAQTHPSALPADDWAHEGLREAELGVLVAAT